MSTARLVDSLLETTIGRANRIGYAAKAVALSTQIAHAE